MCPFTYCTIAVACVLFDLPLPSSFTSVIVYPGSATTGAATDGAGATFADVAIRLHPASGETIRSIGANVNFKIAIFQ